MINKKGFEKLGLKNEIMEAIKSLGFESMTPIQRKALPIALEGNDLFGQAQTGTGKTLAFALPVLNQIDSKALNPQALILCPTRELAIQVSQEFDKLAKFMDGVKVLPVYGGQHIDRQLKSFQMGVQIIIATPGRILDHIRRESFETTKIQMVVLDEADEMLNMGFREDIELILKHTEKRDQTLMFSATMPKGIKQLAKSQMRFPEILKVEQRQITVPNIQQYYMEMQSREKIKVLSRLIDIYNPKQTIVFCNTKKKVNDVANSMQLRGYMADRLHGDLQQSQRTYILSKFRNQVVDLLIATDVAARGLDIEDVDLIVNFDIPQDDENYVHRIGRTGRAGREGIAISFVKPDEYHRIRSISKFTKSEILRERVPTNEDIDMVKGRILLGKMSKKIKDEPLEKYRQIINQNLARSISILDLASFLLKDCMEKQGNEEKNDDSIANTGADVGMARLFINAGKQDQVRAGDVVGAITGETELKGDLIGNIDIYDKYTFVEVPKKHAKEILKSMKGVKIRSKRINVEVATKKKNYVSE